MNWIKTSAIAVSGIFFMHGAALGAAYIKLGSIQGESQRSGGSGDSSPWTEVAAVSGIEKSDVRRVSGDHGRMTITREIDKATPLLFTTSGESGPNPGELSELQVVLGEGSWTLTDVTVVDIQRRGGLEVTTLHYRGIKASHDAAMNSVRNMKAAAATSSGGPVEGRERASATSRATAAVEANHNTTRSNKTAP